MVVYWNSLVIGSVSTNLSDTLFINNKSFIKVIVNAPLGNNNLTITMGQASYGDNFGFHLKNVTLSYIGPSSPVNNGSSNQTS